MWVFIFAHFKLCTRNMKVFISFLFSTTTTLLGLFHYTRRRGWWEIMSFLKYGFIPPIYPLQQPKHVLFFTYVSKSIQKKRTNCSCECSYFAFNPPLLINAKWDMTERVRRACGRDETRRQKRSPAESLWSVSWAYSQLPSIIITTRGGNMEWNAMEINPEVRRRLVFFSFGLFLCVCVCIWWRVSDSRVFLVTDAQQGGWSLSHAALTPCVVLCCVVLSLAWWLSK